MIDQNMTYDFLPGTDPRAWEAFAKKAIAAILKAPGVVEFRANRNVLGTPQVRTSTLWQNLGDWARFSESAEWHALEAEMRTMVTGIRVELWGPSPIVPEPLRPAR